MTASPLGAHHLGPGTTQFVGWLRTASGRTDFVPATDEKPADLGVQPRCVHALGEACLCPLRTSDGPFQLSMRLDGTVVGPRPVAAAMVGCEFLEDHRGDTWSWRRELLGVAVSPLCERCLGTRGALRFAAGLVRDAAGESDLLPLCHEHLDGGRLVELEELRVHLGCEVSWASPNHVFTRALVDDHSARYPQPPPAVVRRYVTDLGISQESCIFAEHLRSVDDGTYRLAPWARLVRGVPGTDVPIARADDGNLVIDLALVEVDGRIRPLGPEDDAFTITVVDLADVPRLLPRADDLPGAA